jgi:nitrogen-specific signal transduction histidine kinase
VPIKNSKGSITGAQTIIEDISEHRRAETLLLRSERLRALVEMAGGVAGNFSNALQVVTADAHMAISSLEAGNYSDLRPLLEQIRDNSQQVALTVRRLQQFAHVQSAIGISHGKRFDAADAIRQAVERSQHSWKTIPEKQGVSITMETDLAPECYVTGESEEIIEVMVNLIKNAAEALPSGGTIKVSSSMGEGQVVLKVQDDGVGIPKKNLSKSFEPFWTSKGSAGMGLAVCAGIVRRHNGSIAITSKERKGTTFVVKLPQAKKPAELDRTVIEEVPKLRYRILIIDRDDKSAKALQEGLDSLQHEALTVQSSGEGLKVFDEGEIDAVVCDLATEGANSWEIGSRIKTISVEKGFSKKPAVILTGWPQQLSEDQIVAHPDVDRIIEKPVDARRLLDIIGEETSGQVAAAAFSGSIHGIDILEYVQLLLLSGQQSLVEIVSIDGTRGLLFVDKGGVRHAESGDLEGEEAFYKCLGFRGGSFSSLPWREPGRTTIDRPGEYLLFQAARMRDEMTE